MRIRLLLALAVTLPGAARAQAPATFAVRPSAAPCLRIRPSPDTASQPIACVPPGTTVQAVGVAAYWRQVHLASGQTGWAAKKFLAAADSGAAEEPGDRDDAWLDVHIVDVGQGDAIWIHTFDDNVPGNGWYEGRNIVIDGGPDGTDSRNQFLRYLIAQAHEGAIIDAMIITHPHDDHYPGAAGILRHFDVREFYDSGYPKEGPKWAGFRSLVDAESAEGHPIVEHIGRAAFGTPEWGNELKVQFLYAYPGRPDGLGSGNTLENNASIVLRIEYGTQSILFMGDAEGKDRDDGPGTPRYAERILLDSVGPAALHSTVLKIAHHGSETSSTLPFIAAVDPEYVVVSSGRKPFNGRFLPDSSTLARYCAHNPAVRIYRTDQDDASEGRTVTNDADGDDIVVRTNGRITTVEAYSSGTRITQTACVP
ncbi:MAG TPA: MBL fold metallo-hydrolase [Gemmatimonadales bacterium]|nr:MBL fold metallo-hydrolase [Gemmatimonadales bacterium]